MAAYRSIGKHVTIMSGTWLILLLISHPIKYQPRHPEGGYLGRGVFKAVLAQGLDRFWFAFIWGLPGNTNGGPQGPGTGRDYWPAKKSFLPVEMESSYFSRWDLKAIVASRVWLPFAFVFPGSKVREAQHANKALLVCHMYAAESRGSTSI